MKTCTKCGEVKGLEAFPGKKSVRCGACLRAYKADWAARNAECIREKRKSNPSSQAEYRRSRLREQAPVVNARRRELRAADPGRYRAADMANYYASHERHKARARQANKTDPTRNRLRAAAHKPKARLALLDSYVRDKLGVQLGVPQSAVPPALVDLKREQLRLHRLGKQIKQAINQQKEEA